MVNTVQTPGIADHRLDPVQYVENFSDLHAPLDHHEALVAADRCYFCYDAPCMEACPTTIDIPLFIRQISTGTVESAAKTILNQNILGGMCARVCPTETLCEEVCVREVSEGKPVRIGQLQRYATDAIMTQNHPFTRAPDSGKIVAVIGAGPAGLACAHRLAMHGHSVTIFEAHPKAGGLNEYGIAAYKSVDNFAQAEVAWLLKIGGIEIKYANPLGDASTIDTLKKDFNAVFLGLGLGGVNALHSEGENFSNSTNAVEFIELLRQSDNLKALPVGRNIIVIGGGMTAVDAAVQSKLLGAENVTMVYRRTKDRMGASKFEQDLATSKGVRIIYNAAPQKILGDGIVSGVEFTYTKNVNGKLETTGEHFTLPADQVFKAIGQTLNNAPDGLMLERGKIKVNAVGQTSDPMIWAGGDCASGGDDLTVTAVAEGRDAAEAINIKLTTEG
ncbi:MAG: NAD(P)-dependent oxidoreductase [Paracoccaceae bacterium]